MGNEQFVDFHVDDLIKKVPAMLHRHPDSPRFLRDLADRAEVIVAAAAILGDETKAYAERRICVMLLGLALAVVAVRFNISFKPTLLCDAGNRR